MLPAYIIEKRKRREIKRSERETGVPLHIPAPPPPEASRVVPVVEESPRGICIVDFTL